VYNKEIVYIFRSKVIVFWTYTTYVLIDTALWIHI